MASLVLAHVTLCILLVAVTGWAPLLPTHSFVGEQVPFFASPNPSVTRCFSRTPSAADTAAAQHHRSTFGDPVLSHNVTVPPPAPPSGTDENDSSAVRCCVLVLHTGDRQILQRSKELATTLNLPLLSWNSSAQDFVCGSNETSTFRSNSPIRSALESVEHALVYARYTRSSAVLPLHLELDVGALALGIVPFSPLGRTSSTRSRRKSKAPIGASTERTTPTSLSVTVAATRSGSSFPDAHPQTLKPSVPKVTVDFSATLWDGGTSRKRPGKDLLVQAVFGKRSKSSSREAPSVVDLTAGWGTDAMVLLRAGAARVTLVERSPVVTALLRDALCRLQWYEANAPRVKEGSGAVEEEYLNFSSRIQIVEGNGVNVASQLLLAATAATEAAIPGRPHVVYLDPMFPPRTKSAAVKKNMQILHSLLTTQTMAVSLEQHRRDEERDLLQAALALARDRVVVKRPLNLPSGLSDSIPSFSVRGSTQRWDVYLV